MARQTSAGAALINDAFVYPIGRAGTLRKDFVFGYAALTGQLYSKYLVLLLESRGQTVQWYRAAL